MQSLFPVRTINAEYLHPFSYRSDTLNRLVQKLGVPFLPFPLTALVPVFPWMFYFLSARQHTLCVWKANPSVGAQRQII